MREGIQTVYEVANNSDFQVDDDPSLLELMVDDMESSRAFYQPTKYWKGYTAAIIDLFRKVGLRDFRRSKERVLSSFGCLDTIPDLQLSTFLNRSKNLTQDQLKNIEPYMEFANSLWEQGVPVGPAGLNVSNFFSMSERLADAKAEKVGIKLFSELSISRFGNPDGFIKDGSHRTFRSIYYFNFVCFVAQFAELSKYTTVVEIGSGSGAQAEILKKLFPQLTIVLLDLAPQLYSAERYLTKSFPDDVVPYRESNSKNWDSPLIEGKIYFLPLRAIENLAPKGKVLFWNAASFGEMEPGIVKNYAKYIASFSANLFLMQHFSGKHGPRVSVTMPVYEKAFSSYTLIAKSQSTRADSVTPIFEDDDFYHNTFWQKKT